MDQSLEFQRQIGDFVVRQIQVFHRRRNLREFARCDAIVAQIQDTQTIPQTAHFRQTIVLQIESRQIRQFVQLICYFR